MQIFDSNKIEIRNTEEFEKLYRYKTILYDKSKIFFNLSFFLKTENFDTFSEENLDNVIHIIKNNIDREFIIADTVEPIFPYIENISNFIKICKSYNKKVTILTGQNSEDIFNLYESFGADIIFLPLLNYHFYNTESIVYTEFCKENTLSKRFLSLNRVKKPSRITLYSFLKENDLLKFGEYSFVFENDVSFNEEIDKNDNIEYMPSILNKFEFHKNCFLNFTVESVNQDYFIFDNKKIKTNFVSEKTLKCIYAPLPFIIIGEQNIIQKLNSYGIKTFSEFWNENYDLESNIKDREEKSFSILKSICYETPSVLRDIYNQTEKIYKENSLIIDSILSDNLKLLKQKIDL